MAGKDFVDSKLAVAGVDLQPFWSVSRRGRIWLVELWAGLLSTQDIGGLASVRPGCVVIAVMRGLDWSPQAL